MMKIRGSQMNSELPPCLQESSVPVRVSMIPNKCSVNEPFARVAAASIVSKIQ